MELRFSLLLASVGSGCSVGIGFPSVLLLESLTVASESPSLLETVGSGCLDAVCLIVVLASLTVDSIFSPLLPIVGVDGSVGTGVPCVLILESFSVASTFPSLPGEVGPGCPPGVCLVVVLASFTVDSKLSPLPLAVGSGCPVGTGVFIVLPVDSRLLPLLETVAIGCSVGNGVPWVLVLESLSVAITLSSLLETAGSGGSDGVWLVLVLASLTVGPEFPPLLATVLSGS